MGEFNATLTLANSSIVTLPIVMYRLIGSYNIQGACALGTILIAVCAIVFIVSELAKGGNHGR
jgi:thiamine transport system permease protein